MTRVSRIELRLVGLPLVRPFRTSFGIATRKECVVVRIETDRGSVACASRQRDLGEIGGHLEEAPRHYAGLVLLSKQRAQLLNIAPLQTRRYRCAKIRPYRFEIVP